MIAAAAVFLGTVLLGGLSCRIALRLVRRLQLVDQPNLRSSHEKPTPRGGGIGILLALLPGVVVGGFLKFVLNEGLARWQLATGQTLLEGTARRLGRAAGWLFLPYLLLWSFFVGSALTGACGVTLHAMAPVFDDAVNGKIAFGILSSLAGLGLVLAGGFPWFEKVMSGAIVVMVITVTATAVRLGPELAEVARGLFRRGQLEDALGLRFEAVNAGAQGPVQGIGDRDIGHIARCLPAARCLVVDDDLTVDQTAQDLIPPREHSKYFIRGKWDVEKETDRAVG